MRKKTQLLGALLTLCCFVAPAAPAVATPKPSIRIAPSTSAIWLYPTGDGFTEPPLYPATSVNAKVKHCPAGTYLLSESLVQDGVSAEIAMYGAMGWSVVQCAAGRDAIPTIGFYSPTLHSGRAIVTVTLAGVDGAP
ncbi:MAG: hypothetical protein QOE79_2890, partial [Sphingomonadales bacterium]|nr:hypothetical protein [Sphingomonadales bacterium]